MNDLPLTAPPASNPGSNLPEYTVSELSLALKRSIEDGFGQVRVRGEISGFKRPGSGHCYFALKDADAVLDAVCWRATAIRLGLNPEDGMEVVCSGRLTTYPGRSKYQLVVDTIELAGKGALLRLLEERRLRLAAEGLFAAERKRALPFLPEVIGIVTSPSGAVIRDILHRLPDGCGRDGGAGAARPRRRCRRQVGAPRRRPFAALQRAPAPSQWPRARPARPAGSARRRRAAPRRPQRAAAPRDRRAFRRGTAAARSRRFRPAVDRSCRRCCPGA